MNNQEEISNVKKDTDIAIPASMEYCGYCQIITMHCRHICLQCGSDNTRIQGFNSNLM